MAGAKNCDLIFYEGLHGGFIDENVNIAKHVDLLIGVTPTINLEWIQKIRRDSADRGHNLKILLVVFLDEWMIT